MPSLMDLSSTWKITTKKVAVEPHTSSYAACVPVSWRVIVVFTMPASFHPCFPLHHRSTSSLVVVVSAPPGHRRFLVISPPLTPPFFLTLALILHPHHPPCHCPCPRLLSFTPHLAGSSSASPYLAAPLSPTPIPFLLPFLVISSRLLPTPAIVAAAAAVVVVAAATVALLAAAETNHNEGCGSFLGHTSWVSHFLGPPVVLCHPRCRSLSRHIPRCRWGCSIGWGWWMVSGME